MVNEYLMREASFWMAPRNSLTCYLFLNLISSPTTELWAVSNTSFSSKINFWVYTQSCYGHYGIGYPMGTFKDSGKRKHYCWTKFRCCLVSALSYLLASQCECPGVCATFTWGMASLKGKVKCTHSTQLWRHEL